MTACDIVGPPSSTGSSGRDWAEEEQQEAGQELPVVADSVVDEGYRELFIALASLEPLPTGEEANASCPQT